MLLQKMQQKKKKKGFTLVELLVVIAIIAILVMIGLPRFMNATGKANKATFEANHRAIVSAIGLYVADNDGKLPENMAALTGGTTKYIDDLNGKPKDASYKIEGEKLTSVYDGETLTYEMK